MIVRDVNLLAEFEKSWETHFAKLLFFSPTNTSLSTVIRKQYFGDEEKIGKQQYLSNYTKLFSEREYFVGTHHSAKLHAKVAPTYLFYFAKPVPLSFGQILQFQFGIFHPMIEIALIVSYQWIMRNIAGVKVPNSGNYTKKHLTFVRIVK